MSKKLISLSFVFLVILLFLGFLFKSQIVSNFLIDQKIASCGQKNDQKCFADLIMDVFNNQGLGESLNMVSLVYEKYPSFSSSCHDIVHLLGKETYRMFESDNDFEITPKAAFCSYGFYHGFMENLVSSQGDVKSAREFCEYVDAQISKETPDATLQCFHGIGHGWVNIHDDKSLWGDEEKIAKKGLSLCEQVSQNESEISRCATGVFNGISVFYATNEYDIKIKQEDPLWLCKTQPEKYQNPCFISMNIILTSLTGGDIKEASKYIDPIIDDTIASHAMLNLAIPFGLSNINNESHQESVVICRSLSPRLVESCIQGYAFAFLEHGEPEKEYVKPLSFCKAEYLTNDESLGCLSYIYSYLIQWYPREKAEAICNNEDEFKDFCLQKINPDQEST